MSTEGNLTPSSVRTTLAIGLADHRDFRIDALDLANTRHSVRNRVMFLLSVKAGLLHVGTRRPPKMNLPLFIFVDGSRWGKTKTILALSSQLAAVARMNKINADGSLG